MPIEIVRNDITEMYVDAIVNFICSFPEIGPGADSRIHKKAGPELLTARSNYYISPGHACVTQGFRLPAEFVIHARVPAWNGGNHDEERLLQCCYTQALRMACRRQCESIAFPLSEVTRCGFPKDKALQIAMSVFNAFQPEREMMIYLVVCDDHASKLSQTLFHDIADYVAAHYWEPQENVPCVPQKQYAPPKARRRRLTDLLPKKKVPEDIPPCGDTAVCASEPLRAYLEQEDAGFTETLLKLIDKAGRKDAEVYKRANLSKQHFSKIRNNPNYNPSKATAIALALALELDLEQTKDLIGRAGYALSNSSKFDLIIRYFIEKKHYNIVEINIALYEFDQNLLGS